MIRKGISISDSKILVLGITFKENCPDIRNSRVVDVIQELNEYGIHLEVYDPWADKDEVKKEYNVSLIDNLELNDYDVLVLAVAHDEFKSLNLRSNNKRVVFDIKSIVDRQFVDGRL